MNLRQLEYFIAIAEEGSFRAAAERVRVAPPSLSQQIRVLEAELGGPLLERLARGSRLTPAGRALLPEARAAVLAARRGGRAARAALDLEQAELEVATVLSLAVGLLPTAIERLYLAYPGIAVRLHEYIHGDELARAVADGVGDIAVGPAPPDREGPARRARPRAVRRHRRASASCARVGRPRPDRRPGERRLDPVPDVARAPRPRHRDLRARRVRPARRDQHGAGGGGRPPCVRRARRRDRAGQHRSAPPRRARAGARPAGLPGSVRLHPGGVVAPGAGAARRARAGALAGICRPARFVLD